MKITAQEAIIDALSRYKMLYPDVKPTRVILGRYAYVMLHKECQEAGFECVLYPETEDERLEYNGMKVYCHNANNIEFE